MIPAQSCSVPACGHGPASTPVTLLAVNQQRDTQMRENMACRTRQAEREEDVVPRLEAIVINCTAPAALALFYSQLLGMPVDPVDAAAIAAGTLGADEPVLLGSRDGLHVWLTPVGDLQPAPGRVHLDARLDAAEDIGGLIALGATWQWEDPQRRWTVLADPEGNLFCAVYPATP